MAGEMSAQSHHHIANVFTLSSHFGVPGNLIWGAFYRANIPYQKIICPHHHL